MTMTTTEIKKEEEMNLWQKQQGIYIDDKNMLKINILLLCESETIFKKKRE